jgi:hypothetical protein
MKKPLVLMLIAVSTLLAAGAVRQALSQEQIVLGEETGFDRLRRPEVIFNHEDHNEAALIEECNECHHVYEDGVKLADESSEDEKCADCHGLEPSGDQPGLRRAFHLNCKGCHLQRRKGPVMCGQCHATSRD